MTLVYVSSDIAGPFLPLVAGLYICSLLIILNRSPVERAARVFRVLTEQYIGTQLLKSGYIHSLTGESFYNGLMLDIMKMSLYHANRVYASACISPEKKRQYLENLIPPFSYPSHWHLDKNLMKLLPFLLF